MSQEDNAQAIKTLAAKGIKVAKPDAKLAGEFAAIGKTISQEWAKRAGAEGEAILKAYSK
jgi:TRAP-type C4-dicarboxylate transport system substrate-binding protein